MTGPVALSRLRGASPDVPASAEELYRQDGSYIKSLVRRQLGGHASDQDIEDIASEIVTKLIARNVIAMYDPGHSSKARWRTFLGSQVLLYCRGMGETLGRRRVRELPILDTDTGESAMKDLLVGASWDDYSHLEDEEFLERIRATIAAAPEWQAGEIRLVDLFDLLVRRLKDGEPPMPSRKAVEALGVPSSAAKTGLALLKTRLRSVLRAAAPPTSIEVAGVELTVPQTRAAIRALRESKGNRVAPALAAVDSPLASLGTKTFIEVGRQELRGHPECKVPRGDKTKHGSQTKVALIHLLERMLILAAPPQEIAPARSAPAGSTLAADDEPALEEVLEARLWRLRGMTKEDIEEILALARRAFS